MIDCNDVGTPQNISSGALIAANVCMGKINNIKNVALNKVACGVKLIKDSIKRVRKNKKVNKLKNLNNNQLAEVLQNRTPGCSSTDKSGAAPTGQQLRKNKQVSFNNSKSEVLFKEGWKTNELANRSVIKGIKIDFNKETLNDDFIVLDNEVENADVDSKIEIMHDTNVELNKICKINNKFENIVFNATMANKNNEAYPIEIVSLDWDNNIKINVSSAEEFLRVDCNFAFVKDTVHSGDSADSRELPTSELQAVAALPKVLPTNNNSVNRTLKLYNEVNNNEFYNVSCFNLLKNQYNYIIDEEYDCFSEVMTSFLQPPFAIFRLLFSCIFAILNNFSINKNKVLNKANIAPVELNEYHCVYILNNFNSLNDNYMVDSREALKDLIFSAGLLFDLPYKSIDSAEHFQHSTVMTDTVKCLSASTVQTDDNNSGVLSNSLRKSTLNVEMDIAEDKGEHETCLVDNLSNSNDIFTIYVGVANQVVLALADTGAVYSSIHPDLVKQLRIPTHDLPTEVYGKGIGGEYMVNKFVYEKITLHDL
ncbi:unnamed protein product, partial [Rotaria magnacalcarata]